MKKAITVCFVLIAVLGLSVLLFNKKSTISPNLDGGSSLSNYADWMNSRLRNPMTGEIPKASRARELAFARTLPGAVGFDKYSKIKALTTDWTLRGPINVGGRTRAMAFDVTNENIILAAGVSSGMWRSVNGGITWTRTTQLSQMGSATGIAQDKRKGKEKIWYYGTGEFIGNSAFIQGNGIFKSTDGGLNWNPIKSTTTGNSTSWDSYFDYIYSIVTNPANANQDEVVAACASGAIVRSTDGGNNWATVLGAISNSGSMYTDIAVTSTGVYYATMSEGSIDKKGSKAKGIFRSIDGVNWKNITPANMPAKYNRIVIAIAPSNENQVYFVGETPSSGKLTRNSFGDSLWHSLWKYTYQSGDGTGTGGNWEDRSQNLPKPANIRGHFNSQGGYDLVLAVKPDNPDVLFVGASSFYRSNDGFKTENNWKWIGGYCLMDTCTPTYYRYTNHHPDLHAIMFLPSNSNVMFTGSDGGVHKTLTCMADNPAYDDMGRGYFTTQFYTVGLEHTIPDNQALIGGLQDNGTQYTYSGDLNTDWTSPTASDGFNCGIADGGKYIYTSHNSFNQPKIRIWRSEIDAKGNVVKQKRIDPIGGRDFIWNTPIILDPNNSNRMFVAGGKILWRHNDLSLVPMDGGKDSISVGWDSLSNTRITDGSITAVCVSKKPANIVYYGTSNGYVYRVDNANTGDPKVVNVTGIGTFPLGSYISCIAVDPLNASNVLVSFSNFGVLSMYYSTDAGATWTPVSGNLEQYPNGSGDGPSVQWVSIMNVKGKSVYLAGTTTGLYSTASLDGMTTIWVQEGATSIGNTVVDYIDVRDIDGTVAVGTHGMGAFTAKITTLPSPPAKPVLTGPDNGTRGIKKSLTLNWTKVPDSYYYKLEISKSQDFSTIENTYTGISDNKYVLDMPEQGLVTFYWRVTARNSGGYGEASDAWNYVTAINPPELVQPPHASDTVSTNPRLIWNPMSGADKYHLEASNSLVFSKKIADTVLTGTYFDLKGLLNGKRYYWRVSSINADGEGLTSSSFNFTTIVGTDVTDNLNYQNSAVNITNLYPMPSSDRVTVEFDNPSGNSITCTLYDSRGYPVINKTLGNSATAGSVWLDLKNISNGIYFINIKSTRNSVMKKIEVIK